MKKDEIFSFLSCLSCAFLRSRLEEKKMKATPLIIFGGLESSSIEFSCSKRRKKTSVWLFPLLYRTRESGTRINHRAHYASCYEYFNTNTNKRRREREFARHQIISVARGNSRRVRLLSVRLVQEREIFFR